MARGAAAAFGVTAFCPTTVACTPEALAAFLEQVSRRAGRRHGAARACCRRISRATSSTRIRRRAAVDCLRLPPASAAPRREAPSAPSGGVLGRRHPCRDRRRTGTTSASSPWRRSCRAASTSCGRWWRPAIACRSATRAPTTTRRWRRSRPAPATPRTSSTACRRCRTARRAWPARCWSRDDVAVELIADGVHVHPAMCRMAIAAKGTRPRHGDHRRHGGCGPAGRRDRRARRPPDPRAPPRRGARRRHAGRQHGRRWTASSRRWSRAAARRWSMPRRCARRRRRASWASSGHGVIAEGAVADLVVLGPAFDVRHTLVGGRVVYRRIEVGCAGLAHRPQCSISAAAWPRTPSDPARRSPGTRRGARGTCCTGRSGRRCTGFMHESVSSSGTPSSSPSRTTSLLCMPANGASMAIVVGRGPATASGSSTRRTPAWRRETDCRPADRSRCGRGRSARSRCRPCSGASTLRPVR